MEGYQRCRWRSIGRQADTFASGWRKGPPLKGEDLIVLSGPKSTTQMARRLRREMSLPEVLLWRELKQRPGGLKFRKQHPAGPYAADFFCHEARLIVEVDGEAHDRGDRPERDEKRDAWFEERRFRVLRVPAVEVLKDVEAVLLGIVAAAGASVQGSDGAR